MELHLLLHGPSLEAEALSSENKDSRELSPQARQGERQFTANVGSMSVGQHLQSRHQQSPAFSPSSEAANTPPPPPQSQVSGAHADPNETHWSARSLGIVSCMDSTLAAPISVWGVVRGY